MDSVGFTVLSYDVIFYTKYYRIVHCMVNCIIVYFTKYFFILSILSCIILKYTIDIVRFCIKGLFLA